MSELVTMPESAPWSPDDTENWLSKNPLPGDFKWPHKDPLPNGTENLQPVMPSYRLHKGYGFWLRTTPYFRGLFEEIHAVLLGCADVLPTPDQLAEVLIERRRAVGTQQKLF